MDVATFPNVTSSDAATATTPIPPASIDGTTYQYTLTRPGMFGGDQYG